MLRSFSEKYSIRNFAYDSGTDAVREYLTFILNTPKGTRAYYPDFGSNLHKYQYAPLNQTLIREVHAEIRNCVNQVEGITVLTTEYDVNIKLRQVAFKFYLMVDGERMQVSLGYKDGSVQ